MLKESIAFILYKLPENSSSYPHFVFIFERWDIDTAAFLGIVKTKAMKGNRLALVKRVGSNLCKFKVFVIIDDVRQLMTGIVLQYPVDEALYLSTSGWALLTKMPS